jgi:hypothetical protein
MPTKSEKNSLLWGIRDTRWVIRSMRCELWGTARHFHTPSMRAARMGMGYTDGVIERVTDPLLVFPSDFGGVEIASAPPPPVYDCQRCGAKMGRDVNGARSNMLAPATALLGAGTAKRRRKRSSGDPYDTLRVVHRAGRCPRLESGSQMHGKCGWLDARRLWDREGSGDREPPDRLRHGLRGGGHSHHHSPLPVSLFCGPAGPTCRGRSQTRKWFGSHRVRACMRPHRWR